MYGRAYLFTTYLQSTFEASRFSWPGLYSMAHSMPALSLLRLASLPPIETFVRLLDIDEDI